MKKILMSIISLAFMALSTSAMAATATGTLNVSATGVVTCTSGSTPINFGNYDGTAAVDVMGGVNVSCNTGTTVTYSLDTGANYDTANATRRLANGTNYLAYEVYQSSANSIIFGDGTHGSTLTRTYTGAGGHAAWGHLAAGQNIVAGAYSDVINVTVTY